MKKNRGRLTGWVNYSYSQTQIHINGRTSEEQINQGNWYPANYNKPNNLNVVLTYSPTKRISYSANFTYSTGRPVTYPTNRYYIGTLLTPNYTTRNEDRIPDYHRLDVSMTVEPSQQKKSRFRGIWVFSIYNVYGRQNAFSVYTKTISPGTTNTYKLSIFGAVFPSITYNFKF